MLQSEMLKYQELDGQLRKMKNDLEKNEFRIRGKKLNALRQQTEDYMSQLDGKAIDLNNQVATLRKKYDDVVKHIEEYSKLADDIRDTDELNYLKKKINTQLDLLKSIEKELSDIASSAEKIFAEYAETVKVKLPQILSQYRECNNKFNEIISTSQPVVDGLRTQLNQLEKVINPEIMEIYKKIRQQNIYPVFVLLEGKLRCGGCRMDLSGSAVSRIDESGYIRCEHCGRIVYKAE